MYRTVVSLSVTLMYCGQTVGWNKMKLGKLVGLGPGHIVLDEDPAPLPRRAQPPVFDPCLVAKRSPSSATAEHLLQRVTRYNGRIYTRGFHRTVFGRPFVKRFALCYQTVVCLPCL